MITLFGNMLMLLFWEAHARYLLAFAGTIYLITCFSLDKLIKEKQ